MQDPTSYSFETINDPADPQFQGLTFNNLLGINNFGEIAGFTAADRRGIPTRAFS